MIDNNIALIDLDGTVADFDLEMERRMDLLKCPGEPSYSSRKDVPDYILERRNLIKKQPGFWRNLPRLELGFEIINELLSVGFRLNVLTKCSKENPNAWSEKIQWSVENLPDAQYTIVNQDKSIVYGKILVDDWPSYFLPWLDVRPRGLVISVAQPWNKDIYHPNFFRYDGSNKDELKFLINKSYDR